MSSEYAQVLHDVDRGNSIVVQPLPLVIARVGLRRSSIYAMMKKGEFPRQARMGQDSASAGILRHDGDYSSNGKHGECDLVVESSQTLIFLELKKKALTRRARAGVDVDLLLDLAGSMLAAQAQAGWHRHRISKEKFLDLSNENGQYHLSLNERDIERIAVGMLDFGSFQDRTTLHKFFEAMLSAKLNVYDKIYKNSFDDINDSFQEIRDQYNYECQGASEVNQPFFNCWFMSVPQVLIMLDRVSDADSFRTELWSYRHVTTGVPDLYY